MYEEHHPDSLVLECVWQARATKDERYLVPAVEHWDLWFTRAPDGQPRAGLAGPTLGHRWVRSTIGEHSWGIQLKAHVVLPGVSKRILLGGEQPLVVEAGHVTLARHAVPVPEFADLEDFTELLAGLRRLPGGKRKDELTSRVEAAIRPYRDTEAIIAFDAAAAPRCADILAVRESAGLPIATGDAQTAAICRSRDAVCATRNTKDFIHTGAALINPWTGEEQPSTVEVLRDLGGVLAQPADAL